MKKIINQILLFLIVPLIMSSCLTTESKVYNFAINYDGSGYGTIKYVNIVSQKDGDKDESDKDFKELINDYIEGNSFEEDNPNYKIISKRLYEKDNKLMGEIKFTFDNYEDIKFFKNKNCKCSSLYYYKSATMETLAETDGEIIGNKSKLPIIRWEGKIKKNSPLKVFFKTIVEEDPTEDSS